MSERWLSRMAAWSKTEPIRIQARPGHKLIAHGVIKQIVVNVRHSLTLYFLQNHRDAADTGS